MATLTIEVCAECGKEARRLVEIDHARYCSRECYLTVCKRFFDSVWIQALKCAKPYEVIREDKSRISRIA